MGILRKISKKDPATKTAKEETKVSTKAVSKGSAVIDSKKSRQSSALPQYEFAYRVILGPVLTEKGELLKTDSKYTFFVDRSTNKVEVTKAIKALYGVDPVSVRVINLKGKQVRHGRFQGRRKDRKKAVVTLKSGDSISLAESA